MTTNSPKIAIFDTVYQTMLSFEDNETIDSNQLGVFDEAVAKLDEYSKNWINTRKIDVASALDIYIACNISSKALVGVKERLKQGILRLENPTSVHETIEIVELVREIGVKLKTPTENLNDHPELISRDAILEIVNLTSKLDARGIAQNLIPAPKEALKQFRKSKVSQFMNSFAKNATSCGN